MAIRQRPALVVCFIIPARFSSDHGRRVSDFAQAQVQAKEMGSRSGLFGLRKDGSEFPTETSISILKEKTGPIFFVVLRDVTDKKRAAQEMEHVVTHDGPNRPAEPDPVFGPALARASPG
jgi:hypothetical protein